eukprot:1921145-Amphidinium_carterae.1
MDAGDTMPLLQGRDAHQPVIGQLDIAKYFNGVDTAGMQCVLDRLGLGEYGIFLAAHCSRYLARNRFWNSHVGAQYSVARGAVQGDPFSVWLSLLHVLILMNKVRAEVPGSWNWLAYLDDITICAADPAELQRVMSEVAAQLALLGLTVNWKKSSWTAATKP